MPTERMTIALSSELADMVRQAVESGDYNSSSEVFRDALRDWKHNRRIEQEEIAEIRAAVAEGLEDIKAGRVYPAEQVFAELIAELEKKVESGDQPCA